MIERFRGAAAVPRSVDAGSFDAGDDEGAASSDRGGSVGSEEGRVDGPEEEAGNEEAAGDGSRRPSLTGDTRMLRTAGLEASDDSIRPVVSFAAQTPADIEPPSNRLIANQRRTVPQRGIDIATSS